MKAIPLIPLLAVVFSHSSLRAQSGNNTLNNTLNNAGLFNTLSNNLSNSSVIIQSGNAGSNQVWLLSNSTNNIHVQSTNKAQVQTGINVKRQSVSHPAQKQVQAHAVQTSRQMQEQVATQAANANPVYAANLDNNNGNEYNYMNIPQQSYQPVQVQEVKTDGSTVASASSSGSSSGFGLSLPKVRLSMPETGRAKSSSHHSHRSGKLSRYFKNRETVLKKNLAHTKKVKVNYELCFNWK